MIVKRKKLSFRRWFAKPLPESAEQGSVLDERAFNRTLGLERKRSHRTGNPFVLLVVDLAAVSRVPESQLRAISGALQSETRDTDVCGWYKKPSAIGVIFTALQELDRVGFEAAISAKMNRALSHVVDSADIGKVRMSFHYFPESVENAGKTTIRPDEKLYPELLDAEISKAIHHRIKRLIDIVGSLSFLIAASPVFAVIAIAIRRSSKGPVFFRQIRVGRFGKEFECLKFRTMYTNSDPEIHRKYVQDLIQKPEDSRNVYKIVNDPRVTPVGRLLRKTSLDELPQFINVLLGEMSLVGPRPPIPYEISCYRPWHLRRVIEIKPGITGLWQVYGRSRTTFDEMVRLDIRYIEKQSIWLDMKVLLRTPWAVITCMGAY